MPPRTKSPRPVRLPALTGLTAFDAVARHESFSKAAVELSVTQSAVSHRISQLETLLGATLLIRLGNKVALTPKGDELLPYVRQGLAILRDGMTRIAAAGKPTVRVSLAPAIASNWLVRRLASFQRLHPGIGLDIHVTSENIKLSAEATDVAIRFGSGRWEGLDAIELLPVRTIAVCSPAYRTAHPWLKTPADLARATLLRQTIIAWREWFLGVGVDLPEPQSGPAFSEVSLLIDAAECAQGVGLVFDALVERQLQDGTLIQPFHDEVPSPSSYYIVTPSGAPRAPEVQSFIDWLLTQRTA